MQTFSMRWKIMFADRAKIIIKSGKGGDGHVSFRVKNTCRTVVRTAVTEERAETLYFSWIRESTP